MTDVTTAMREPDLMGSPQRRGLFRRRGGAGTYDAGLDLGRRRTWLQSLLDPASAVPTYVGVAITLLGFALIGFAWVKVAALVDVWRQMPYVVSAGLPGLGLVMTGLVVINVSARRQDGAARARQMATLAEALHELQTSIDR
jgi:hypothetical protein